MAVRTAALVTLVAITLGTSCPAPSTYVFHRFDVAGSVDSSHAAPGTVTLESGRYSLARPKRHWWSAEPPRPSCSGFRLYSSDAPRSLTHEQTQGRGDPVPPYEFEVRVNHAPRPEVVVHYAYRAPRWPIDVTSPVGAAQAERIAEVEATFVREAEALARLVLAGSGAEPVIPASEMQRTRNWKEADALCRRFARTR